jgi:hypothetical protein
MTREDLLATIRAYCEAADTRPSVLTRKAVNNGKLFRRLEDGGECLPSTARKIIAYITANPPPSKAGRDA